MMRALNLAAAAFLAAASPAGSQPATPPSARGAPAPAASTLSAASTGWPVYKNVAYSIAHPPGFAVDAGHEYEGLGNGRAIMGTAFKVPGSFTSGTNLSADSYLSVEVFPRITCTPHAFLLNYKDEPPVTENGRKWLVSADDEGAAGNRYSETVYALADSVPCIGVRYFIHSTELGNYDPGTVQPFDIKRLTAIFDAMRQSLKPASYSHGPG